MATLGLHNLRSARGSTKGRLRVGRGNGSGRGSYSGRGVKGQRARTGGRTGLTMLGVKGYIFKVPKIRGFKSGFTRLEAVTLRALEQQFDTKETITPKKMYTAGLLSSPMVRAKIVGSSALAKIFIVKAHACTPGARAALEKVGGSFEKVVRAKKAVKK